MLCVTCITLQDKAALLANMDPNAVARLLGLMDPNEAVVLLAALGDGNARLVGQALSSEERNRMVQVRRPQQHCRKLLTGSIGPCVGA